MCSYFCQLIPTQQLFINAFTRRDGRSCWGGGEFGADVLEIVSSALRAAPVLGKARLCPSRCPVGLSGTQSLGQPWAYVAWGAVGANSSVCCGPVLDLSQTLVLCENLFWSRQVMGL